MLGILCLRTIPRCPPPKKASQKFQMSIAPETKNTPIDAIPMMMDARKENAVPVV